MKHSIIMAILIVSSMSYLAYAEDTTLDQIYSGWMSYGENLTAAGDTFYISGQSTLEEFAVNLPSGEYVFFTGPGCLAKGMYEICYNGTKEFDWNNHTLDKQYWKAILNISRYDLGEKGLVVFKSYDYREPLLIQEPVRVSIKVYNNGSSIAKSVILKDSTPEQFVVSNVQGCELIGTNIRWYGTLSPEESHFCTYTMEALDNVSFKTLASVDYIYDNEEKTATSSETNVRVSVPRLKIDTFISNNTFNVGDSLFYSLNLTNIDEERELYFNKMYIRIPENIFVRQHSSRLRKETIGYSYKAILDENETEDVWFYADVILKSNATIETEIDYTIRGVNTKVELTEKVIVLSGENITLNISNGNTTNSTINQTGINSTVNSSINSSVNNTLNQAGNASNSSSHSEKPASIITTTAPEEEKPIALVIVVAIVFLFLTVFGAYKIYQKKKSPF